jgi:hypothetical protein
VAFDTTLQAALNDLFQVSLPGSGSSSSTGPPTSVSATVQNLITQANSEFQQAQTDLKAGNFAAYGNDIAALQGVLQKLAQDSTSSPSAKVSTPKVKRTSASSTTTTVPSGVAIGSAKS